MANTLISLINLAATVFSLLILARVLFSWFRPDPYNPAVKFVYDVTEPILAPIRNFLPQTGMIDLSPMVAWLLVDFIIVPILVTLVRSLF
ncbi:MAG: YggT family protein [Chloroflexi bacterium]|nr:YggT family protein [Chloroflexota bacterium]